MRRAEAHGTHLTSALGDMQHLCWVPKTVDVPSKAEAASQEAALREGSTRLCARVARFQRRSWSGYPGALPLDGTRAVACKAIRPAFGEGCSRSWSAATMSDRARGSLLHFGRAERAVATPSTVPKAPSAQRIPLALVNNTHGSIYLCRRASRGTGNRLDDLTVPSEAMMAKASRAPLVALALVYRLRHGPRGPIVRVLHPR